MHHATDIMQFQNYAFFKAHTIMYSWVTGARLGWAITRVSKFAHEIQIVILKITNIVKFTQLFKIYFISRLDESMQNSTILECSLLCAIRRFYNGDETKKMRIPLYGILLNIHSFFHHQVYDFIIAKHIPRAHICSSLPRHWLSSARRPLWEDGHGLRGLFYSSSSSVRDNVEGVVCVIDRLVNNQKINIFYWPSILSAKYSTN